MYRHPRARLYGPLGVEIPRVITGSRAKGIIYWGESEDGDCLYVECPDTKTPSVMAFLQKLVDEFGKVVVLMDGASSHTSKDVQKMIGRMGGRLVVLILPAASPRMSAIEGVRAWCGRGARTCTILDRSGKRWTP